MTKRRGGQSAQGKAEDVGGSEALRHLAPDGSSPKLERLNPPLGSLIGQCLQL